MRIETLTNRIVSIYDVLKNELMHCNSCSIASAFVDDTTISILEYCLLKNKKIKELKFLTGIYGCFNRKANLYKLQQLALKYAIKVEIHISKDKQFHWKYYHFTKGTKKAIYIGSANFTSGGMGDNGELLVKLSVNTSKKDFGFKSIPLRFDKEWEESGAITEFNLDEYNEQALSIYSSKRGRTGNRNFFENSIRVKPHAIASENAVIVYLTDDITVKTEKMIANTKPIWGKRDYFICNSKKYFDYCISINRILLLDRVNKNSIYASWVQYLDNLQLKTPDGKYFIAYSYISKKRKLNRIAIEYLTNKENGLCLKLTGWKDILEHKVIRNKQVMKLEELLQLK